MENLASDIFAFIQLNVRYEINGIMLDTDLRHQYQLQLAVETGEEDTDLGDELDSILESIGWQSRIDSNFDKYWVGVAWVDFGNDSHPLSETDHINVPDHCNESLRNISQIIRNNFFEKPLYGFEPRLLNFMKSSNSTRRQFFKKNGAFLARDFFCQFLRTNLAPDSASCLWRSDIKKAYIDFCTMMGIHPLCNSLFDIYLEIYGMRWEKKGNRLFIPEVCWREDAIFRPYGP